MIARGKRSVRGEAAMPWAVRQMTPLSEGACQNEIVAPSAGSVKKVHVKPGQNVEGKDVLLELE